MGVIRKAKWLCDELQGTLRLLGWISRSSIPGAGNRYSNYLYQWRRHYVLPSPPSPRVLDFLTTAGIHPVREAVVNPGAVESARFAVDVQNEASRSQDGGNTFQFARVLGANRRRGLGGVEYHVTFKALSGKADMEVYYAEVFHRRYSDQPHQMELIKWQHVDNVDKSFRYPSQQIRSLPKEVEMESVQQSLFQKVLNAESSPGIDEIDHCHTFSTVIDIKTFDMLYQYAVFAVMTHNKNEDDKVHLKNVIWACKSKVSNNYWVYRLVLSAEDGEHKFRFYYVIVKAGPGNNHLELIKWYLFPITFLRTGKVDKMLVQKQPDDVVYKQTKMLFQKQPDDVVYKQTYTYAPDEIQSFNPVLE